jgi:FkbM family methyltransferase
MINKFISKLPLWERLLFFTGKFFNKIGHRILEYKNFGYYQEHYNQLVFKKIDVSSNGKELLYNKDGLKALARIATSDSMVFNLVVMGNEYKPATDIFLLNNIPLKVFVDLGSNIGLTTLYIKKEFPDCTVIALEPDKNNYEMMLKNFDLNKLTNTTSLLAGVGKNDCYLIEDVGIRDKKEWGLTFKEVDYPTDIASYSINMLFNKFAIDEIDFIKIDVEGAEKEIFAVDADMSFLKKIKVLAVEIHDEFEWRSQIYKILKENNFIVFNSGETTLAVKKKLFQ